MCHDSKQSHSTALTWTFSSTRHYDLDPGTLDLKTKNSEYYTVAASLFANCDKLRRFEPACQKHFRLYYAYHIATFHQILLKEQANKHSCVLPVD